MGTLWTPSAARCSQKRFLRRRPGPLEKMRDSTRYLQKVRRIRIQLEFQPPLRSRLKRSRNEPVDVENCGGSGPVLRAAWRLVSAHARLPVCEAEGLAG